ncbi:DUF3659 domain-containing protein [Dyadobacter frigoris]|uniref:DUF3659 domain-containing protein n=1 Tax=Dyadobacter frigoris TaxID=2576211 RepID=UPI0025535FA2|nr:DUF3659 domain-containing protein [Dyadobacter frigoris]
MRKLQLLAAALFFIIVTAVMSFGQNYKQPVPSIDAKGKITDKDGKHIGWVTQDGLIKNASGTKIAHMDSNGDVIDAKTGKSLGKTEKNGNYIYHFPAGSNQKLTVSAPMNGTCEVKDAKGKTVLLVHENYKQYGACALHCLQMNKQHKDMKMKQ